MNKHLLFSVAAIVSTAAAFSQETRDTVYQLAPITVTATRTVEAVLEVPMAVSVIPRETFQHTRLIGLNEALSLTPGVFAQSRSGGTDARITIRGFGARGNGDRSNAGTIRGLRVLVDGFPITEPDGRTSLDFVDLFSTGSIEVLRSNSSALYGGASGGIIQVNSASDFEKPFVMTGLVTGSFGLSSQGLQAGTTIGDGRLFISAGNTNFTGWRQHSVSTRALLNCIAVAPLGPRGDVTVNVMGTSNLSKMPGPLTRAQLETAPSQADSGYAARDERRFNRQGRLGVRLSHSIDQIHAISASAFAEHKIIQRSERGRFRDFNRYHLGGSATYRLHLEFSDGLRLLTLAGIDEAYQDGSILFYSLDGGNRGTSLKANKQEAANNLGLFLQEELMISSQWSIVLGVRYDILSYGADDFIDPRFAATKRFAAWTPKLGLSYRWKPTHTIYASLGGGLEIPAFNEIDPPPPFDTLTAINPFLDPMRSRTYEVGAKGIQNLESSLLSSISYDLAAYVIDVNNDIIPFNGGAYFLTAGMSRRKGIEIGMELHSKVGLSLQSALTITDNKYVDYMNELGDFSGKKVAGLPTLTANAVVRYTSPWHAYVECGMEHVGSYYADDANSPEGRVPSCVIYRATLGGAITVASIAVDAYVGIRNLTDAKYIASAFINGVSAPNTALPRFFEPGLPRNVVAGLSVRWNVGG